MKRVHLATWILFAVFAIGAIRPALAGSMPVVMETMTWPEVQARLEDGATTVLIPTGGTEQNGPHMALGKHNAIVAETARRIAEALGDALVAPVLAYVPEGDIEAKQGHMAYAGTVSVPAPVFAAVLAAAAASYRAHGFQTIVFVGDSGGNQAVQDEIASHLTRKWRRDDVRVINANTYYRDNGGEAQLIAEGESHETIGRHAGIRDTSELMAVAPQMLRPELFSQAANEPQLGASGDPRRASAARGEMLLQLKVAAAVKEIRMARDETP